MMKIQQNFAPLSQKRVC